MKHKACVAIKNNDFEALKKISFLGVGINKPDRWGNTLLTVAAALGNVEIVSYLLKKGADVNFIGGYKDNAVVSAIKSQSREVFKLVAGQQDVDFQKMEKIHRQNIISLAYQAKAYEIVDELLTRDWPEIIRNPLVVGREDRNAFSYACAHGDVNEIKKLHRYIRDIGCDVEIEQSCEDGLTPAMYAVKSGSLETLKFLIEECGADISCEDRQGYGLLHVLPEEKGLEIARYLLTKGIKLDGVSKSKTTPFMNAVIGNRLELATLFLDQGADINHKNEDGNTTLMRVVRCDNAMERIKYLLRHKANIHLKNNKSKTAVMLAKASTYREKIEYALKNDNWLKISDHEIAHIELKEILDLTIKDIFNFKTHERTRVIENTKMATMAMEISSLGKVHRDTLNEAFNNLEKLGGQPEKYCQLSKGPVNGNLKPIFLPQKKGA